MNSRTSTVPASTKHTPGPWEKDGLVIRAANRGIIALLPTPQTGGVFDVQDNGDLIAAAPELLEALKDADRVICRALDAAGFDELYPNREEREAAHAEHVTIKKIRAAITKAGAQ